MQAVGEGIEPRTRTGGGRRRAREQRQRNPQHPFTHEELLMARQMMPVADES
jgi:hypothetical protein